MIDTNLRGEVVDFDFVYAPGTAATVPTELLLRYADGRVIRVRSSTFHFDQFLSESCLEIT